MVKPEQSPSPSPTTVAALDYEMSRKDSRTLDMLFRSVEDERRASLRRARKHAVSPDVAKQQKLDRLLIAAPIQKESVRPRSA